MKVLIIISINLFLVLTLSAQKTAYSLKFKRFSEGKLIAIEKYHRVDLAVY